MNTTPWRLRHAALYGLGFALIFQLPQIFIWMASGAGLAETAWLAGLLLGFGVTPFVAIAAGRNWWALRRARQQAWEAIDRLALTVIDPAD